MKSSRTDLTETIHRRAHWHALRYAIWVLVTGLLAAAAITLCSGETLLAKPEGWMGLALGLVLLFTLVATYLTWRSGRIEADRMVRDLDRELAASNRLEAMEELAGSDRPLARAQRRETDRFLEGRKPAVLSTALLTGLAIAAVLLVSEVLVALSWITIPTMKFVEIPPLESDKPTGEIVIVEPESEYKATPIQEVPVEAKSTSSHGMQDMELRVSVNGGEAKSVPVEENFSKAGKHEFDFSLYLDEFEVQEYDLVTYHLAAKLSDPSAEKHPDYKPVEVTSALQFVEVRPLRDEVIDLGQGTTPPGDGDPCLKCLLELKIAQLGLSKMNFMLAHTQQPKDTAIWKDENKLVGDDQMLLVTKAEEAIDLFIQEGKPAEMVNLLTQVPQPMEVAGERILATENKLAISPQQVALAKIIEIQKLFVKVTGTGPPPPPKPPGPKDPFDKREDFKLKPRELLAAGLLEEMLKQQKELNELMKQEDPGKSKYKGGEADRIEVDDPNNWPAPKTAGGSVPADKGKPDKPGDKEPQPEKHADKPGQKPGDKPGQGEAEDQKMAGEKPADSGQSKGQGQGKGAGDKEKKGKGGTKEMADAQKKIGEELEKLASDASFSPAVSEHIKQARDAAKEAGRQLDAKDPTAAREPGERAKEAMTDALAQMEKEGKDSAAQAMAHAQRKLNEAQEQQGQEAGDQPGEGSGPNPGPGSGGMASQLQQLRDQLAQAAAYQQSHGSEAAAQVLAELGKEMDNGLLSPDKDGDQKMPGKGEGDEDGIGLGEDEGKGEKNMTAKLDPEAQLEALIEKAVEGQAAMQGSRIVLENTHQELLRLLPYAEAAANMESGKGPGKMDPDTAREIIFQVKGATQKVEVLITTHSDLVDLTQDITDGGTTGSGSGKGMHLERLKIIAKPLKGLIALIEEKLDEASREEIIAISGPQDAPRNYREAVSAYYERLSRQRNKETEEASDR